LLRADFPKLYASRLAFLEELIGPDSWPEADNQWERYVSVKSSKKMREEFLQYAGFGLFNQMGENDSVTYDQMLQGPEKNVTHTLYGLGFQINFLTQIHDLDNLIAKNAPELGRSMRMSVQTLAAALWNGAYDTVTTADGQNLFSTAHTFIRGGGTFSNRSSTDASLGHTALETGLVNFRLQKDFMGNPMPLQPKTLLIPPALEPIAHELMNSNMRHDTTTHADSFVAGKLNIESWPFLTITTAWQILGRKEDMKIFWFWSFKPQTFHGFDFDRHTAKTKIMFVSSTVPVDPRGTYGSKGA